MPIGCTKNYKTSLMKFENMEWKKVVGTWWHCRYPRMATWAVSRRAVIIWSCIREQFSISFQHGERFDGSLVVSPVVSRAASIHLPQKWKHNNIKAELGLICLRIWKKTGRKDIDNHLRLPSQVPYTTSLLELVYCMLIYLTYNFIYLLFPRNVRSTVGLFGIFYLSLSLSLWME